MAPSLYYSVVLGDRGRLDGVTGDGAYALGEIVLLIRGQSLEFGEKIRVAALALSDVEIPSKDRAHAFSCHLIAFLVVLVGKVQVLLFERQRVKQPLTILGAQVQRACLAGYRNVSRGL